MSTIYPNFIDKVIRELSSLGDVTIYGTLREEEGLAKIEELNGKVDLVVIGGAYTDEQRKRIKAWLAQKYPQIKLTQPGSDYPFSNDAINENFQKLLNL